MSSDKISISIPVDTCISGKFHQYTIKAIACMSNRTFTYNCIDETGKAWRLKLYNGMSSVSKEKIVRILQVKPIGTVLPTDIGEYANTLFTVFPLHSVSDFSQTKVSITFLADIFIPQMANILNSFHKNGIIIRDICPEHILFSEKGNKMAFSGVGNTAQLTGKANMTFEPGFSHHKSYIAPEIEKSGYGIASDFFALGVTLLTIVKGYNPMENISRNVLLSELSKGLVPGIDVEHLKNTSPKMYSLEDQIYYLILGLMIPNPQMRWGYNEIQCWIKKQFIPITYSGVKVDYQFSEPFVIGGEKCWNKNQLATAIAKQKTDVIKNEIIKSLPDFCKKIDLNCAEKIYETCHNDTLSLNSKIFKCVYLIEPSLNGFWWNGQVFHNLSSLSEFAVASDENITFLSEILKNKCLSFFLYARSSFNVKDKNKLNEFINYELWEEECPKKGAYRCAMSYFAQKQDRFFWLENKRFKSVDELLANYYYSGKKLKEISASILKNKMFLAWLWANGYGNMGEKAVIVANDNPDMSFVLLLEICEAAALSKKAVLCARELYMRWGNYAPIFWLIKNIDGYQCNDYNNQIIYDDFKNSGLNNSLKISELSENAQQFVIKYNLFISQTLDNPFLIHNGNIDSVFTYYPLYDDYYFCCEWEDFKVSPAFLKSIDEPTDKSVISGWLNSFENKESERLHNYLNLLPSTDKNKIDGKKILSKKMCSGIIFGNFFITIINLIVSCICIYFEFPYAILFFAVALMFPIWSTILYRNKKRRIKSQNNAVDIIFSKRNHVNSLIDSLPDLNVELLNLITDKTSKKSKVDIKKISSFKLNDSQLEIESIEFGFGGIILGIISFIGNFALIASMLFCINTDLDFNECVIGFILYAIAYFIVLPFIITSGQGLNNGLRWLIASFILLTVMAVGTCIDELFCFGSVVLPVAIGIIVLIICIFL